MKRFKIIVTTLLLATLVGGIFAFTTKSKHVAKLTAQTFQLSSRLANPHVPSNYSAVTSLTSTGTKKVLGVTTSEIYPSNDPNYPNLPKVDQTPAPGNISQRINDVLLTPSQRDIADVNGNIVYLQP